MRLSEFDYHLPEELIAQEPLPDRAGARMMVVDRAAGTFTDRMFREFPTFVQPGDCLVLNNSRVFPSRLYGHRDGFEGRVEVFLTKPVSNDQRTWMALVRPGRKMRTGEVVRFSESLAAKIVGRGEFGERTVRFECEGDLFTELDKVGHVPLPPYIHRADTESDRERYQTVFAREAGSVAAPTAGLHFTPEILAECGAAGAATAYVTLHVGLGTFQPLHSDVIEEVKLHSERVSVAPEELAKIEGAQRRIAVGTTSVRTLESGLTSGETDIFLYPGHLFRRVDAMLTNFHLPKSSLFVLVSAFGGCELMKRAYEHAVEERYRFFSYGDCMLIL